MKKVLVFAVLFAVCFSAPAYARGSTGSTPTIPACTVEHNKCIYPDANLKDKNMFNRLNRWLRKVGPHTPK